MMDDDVISEVIEMEEVVTGGATKKVIIIGVIHKITYFA